MMLRLQQSPKLTLHVLNLHLVTIKQALNLGFVLSLQVLVGVLESKYTANDAVVSHFLIAEDSLTVIDNPPLVVDSFVQFKQLFALQRFSNLRLFQRQRVMLGMANRLLRRGIKHLLLLVIARSHAIIALREAHDL